MSATRQFVGSKRAAEGALNNPTVPKRTYVLSEKEDEIIDLTNDDDDDASLFARPRPASAVDDDEKFFAMQELQVAREREQRKRSRANFTSAPASASASASGTSATSASNRGSGYRYRPSASTSASASASAPTPIFRRPLITKFRCDPFSAKCQPFQFLASKAINFSSEPPYFKDQEKCKSYCDPSSILRYPQNVIANIGTFAATDIYGSVPGRTSGTSNADFSSQLNRYDRTMLKNMTARETKNVLDIFQNIYKNTTINFKTVPIKRNVLDFLPELFYAFYESLLVTKKNPSPENRLKTGILRQCINLVYTNRPSNSSIAIGNYLRFIIARNDERFQKILITTLFEIAASVESDYGSNTDIIMDILREMSLLLQLDGINSFDNSTENEDKVISYFKSSLNSTFVEPNLNLVTFKLFMLIAMAEGSIRKQDNLFDIVFIDTRYYDILVTKSILAFLYNRFKDNRYQVSIASEYPFVTNLKLFHANASIDQYPGDVGCANFFNAFIKYELQDYEREFPEDEDEKLRNAEKYFGNTKEEIEAMKKLEKSQNREELLFFLIRNRFRDF